MEEAMKKTQTVFCEKCNKQFENPGKLKVHHRKVNSPMNLHKKIKHEGLNFPCPHCKHTSSQKGDLKRHIQRNVGRRQAS